HQRVGGRQVGVVANGAAFGIVPRALVEVRLIAGAGRQAEDAVAVVAGVVADDLAARGRSRSGARGDVDFVDRVLDRHVRQVGAGAGRNGANRRAARRVEPALGHGAGHQHAGIALGAGGDLDVGSVVMAAVVRAAV